MYHLIRTPPGAIVQDQWQPIPHHLTGEIHKETEKMLELGVIQPSRSPWRSSLVPVPKLDCTLRLCIDYRRLNEIAIFDALPMPHITEHKFQAPQTPRQLRSFLVLINYYRRFVPHLSELVASLSDALEGPSGKRIKWTGEMVRNFELLKENVVVHAPDFTKSFVLQTDALETAIGAVLT